MSTEYCGKDWSEKPTYAEVVAFSSQQSLSNLVKKGAGLGRNLNWDEVHRSYLANGESYTDWLETLEDLYMKYTRLSECPDCIQDWFNQTYDLTLLLEEG